MTTPSKYYVGDVGTEIELDAETDLSDYTLLKMAVLKPTASVGELWDAAIVGTTKIHHFTEAGDWAIDGDYKYQIVYESLAGSWRGETFTKKVHPRFG